MPVHSFSARSLKNLDVHPDLRKVAYRALELLSDTPYDFTVTDGGRTMAEQLENIRRGVSWTKNSRHIGGFALDFIALVNGRGTYDTVAMRVVAEAFKRAGKELKIPIEWGGDWTKTVDMPHIQLRRKEYPDARR